MTGVFFFMIWHHGVVLRNKNGQAADNIYYFYQYYHDLQLSGVDVPISVNRFLTLRDSDLYLVHITPKRKP